MTRNVIIVPIIHTARDLGTLAPQVRAVYERHLGPAAWSEHVTLVEALWDAIETLLETLDLDHARVKIYQDGLPVCGQEPAIVRDLASRGCRNYIILEKLVERGARLVGTEDPQLLVQEYRRLRALILQNTRGEEAGALAGPAGGPGEDLPPPPVEHPSPVRPEEGCLEARDRFIADRIAATLEEGETALLFVGALHRVEGHLPDTIRVRFLTHRPGMAGRSGT